MKRRTFIQSLAAVFALPAAPSLSMPAAASAAPAAVAAVPTQARFWAIYMSALHGECTPQTLKNLLHIPEVDANRYVSQLIADGVIKPNPLLKNTVSELVKSDDDSLLDKARKRLEKKSRAQSEGLNAGDVPDPEEDDDEAQDVALKTDEQDDDQVSAAQEEPDEEDDAESGEHEEEAYRA